jgi:hypothetical protein
MTRAEAAATIHVSVDVLNNAASIMGKALPEIRAKIRNGEIKTFGHAYTIVTPNKDERREGLTSEEKQRRWLNGHRSQTKREPEPPSPITRTMVNGLTQAHLDAFAIMLAPKVSAETADDLIRKLTLNANRAAARRGKRWTEADL